MRQNDPIDESDAGLIASLQNLELSPPQTSARDIWYAAGQRAGQRQARRWKFLSLGLGVIACSVVARSALPVNHAEFNVKYVRVSPPSDKSVAIDDGSLANLKASAMELATLHDVAEKGLNGLPSADVANDQSDASARFGGPGWMDDPRVGLDYQNANLPKGGRL